MAYPAFFDSVRTIKLHDPLAELLGASDGGLLEYGFHDVVKLAGHSCPTVAGAYVMTIKALGVLYGDEMPVRGKIRVAFRDSQDSGVTGVIANVVSQITGATENNGFKGLAGKYKRTGLMSFNTDIAGIMRFGRIDQPLTVEVDYHPECVPGDRRMSGLLQSLLANDGSAEDRAEFATLWQDRVKRILTDNFDNPALVTLTIR